jgi:hypothetical protein
MTVDNVGQLALRCYRDRIVRRSEERWMGDVAVLSAMIGAAGIGLLLGMSLKASAVLAASAAIAVVGATIAPFTDVSAVTAALTTFGSLLALQCGYLGGLALSCVWSRVRGSSLSARENTLSIGRWVPDRGSPQAG